jgi:predicted transcriptional regulator
MASSNEWEIRSSWFWNRNYGSNKYHGEKRRRNAIGLAFLLVLRNNAYAITRFQGAGMAGRKTLAITDRQFAALEVLWERGPQTVRQLMEHLPRGEQQPYTTVLGLLQNMEKAGLVGHEEEGQTYRYVPAVTRQAATRTLLRDFVARFFRGSAEALVLGLVDSAELTPEDLREIEARLQQDGDTRGTSS